MVDKVEKKIVKWANSSLNAAKQLELSLICMKRLREKN